MATPHLPPVRIVRPVPRAHLLQRDPGKWTWDDAVRANLRAMEAVLHRPRPSETVPTADANARAWAVHAAMEEELAFTEQAAEALQQT